MTTKQTLPDNAGHPSISEQMTDARCGLRAEPASKAGDSWLAPLSILSVAEARRIVMRIVG